LIATTGDEEASIAEEGFSGAEEVVVDDQLLDRAGIGGAARNRHDVGVEGGGAGGRNILAPRDDAPIGKDREMHADGRPWGFGRPFAHRRLTYPLGLA
jgi:hypothetical protein